MCIWLAAIYSTIEKEKKKVRDCNIKLFLQGELEIVQFDFKFQLTQIIDTIDISVGSIFCICRCVRMWIHIRFIRCLKCRHFLFKTLCVIETII